MDENEKKIVNFIDEIRGQTHELEIPLNISANTLIIALKRAYDLNLDENNTIMELKELSRRISRYRANVENLQLEKNRLFNEIDALDQDALKIKEYKWQAQNRFKCRVDNIAGMDRYSSRNITNLKGRLKSINSLNDGKSYVANAMNAIDSMLRDVENAIRSRNDRIYEINQQLCTYEDNIEQLRMKKRRMESK